MHTYLYSIYIYLQYRKLLKKIYRNNIAKYWTKTIIFNKKAFCCQVPEAETMGFRAWVPMLREVPMGANVALIRTCPEKAYICGQPPLKHTKKKHSSSSIFAKEYLFWF